jgi:hypothetical protein
MPAKVISKPVTHVTTGEKKPIASVASKPQKQEPVVKKQEPIVTKAPAKKIYVDDDSSDEYGNWQD